MTSTVRSAAVRLTMENASYIRGANQAAGVTEQAAGRMKRSVRDAAAATGRDWDTMGKYGGRYALAVGAGLGYAEKRIMSFDKTMSAAQAATGAQAAQMAKLRAAAIKAGADTAFTSTDAAQAIVEEGKAGISTANILKGGLRGALDLAAAGSLAVGDAAEYTATALVQFHLRGDRARHVADLLAAAANKAQGEVGDMSNALSYVGVPAHAAGISLEETVGTIALLAKNGLIGEKAGTGLRGMLASLQSPSKQASKVMKDLGIDVYDAHGKFKGFDGVAEELHTRLRGLTDQERQYALGKIFGNEQLQAANILYEAGAKGVHKMTREVNAHGYATEVANKKLDNLAGDWERFTGSLESALLKAGSPAQQGLRDIVQNAEHLVNAFAGLPDEVQQGIVKVAVLTAGIGATLYTISKIRNIAKDFGYIGGRGGRGAAAGALGRAASLAAPVPVFVTNMVPDGLGGVGGKGGGTTILGGAGAAEEGKLFGRIPLKAVARGNLLVGLSAMILEGLGFGKKWHAGSTLSGAGAGSFFGPLGTIGGSIIGGGIDIYHSGSSTKNALDEAKAALASGDIKRMRQAFDDLQASAAKLGHGGASQNFNRFVTEVTGRRKDIEETGKALKEALDPDVRRQTRGDLLYLLSGGKRGHLNRPKPAAPEKEPFETLLNPSRRGVKKPKELTSEEVLSNFYGINPKKLKPVPVLDQLLPNLNDLLPGLTGNLGAKGGGGKGRGGKTNPVIQFAASLGLDTKGFDRKAGAARRKGAELDAMRINPSVKVNTSAAMTELGKFGSYLASLTKPRSVSVSVHVHKGSIGAGGSGDLAGLLNPGTADGGTIMGPRYPYGDKVLTPTAPGEEVISNRRGQADKWRPLLKRINAGLANGGTVGSVASAASAWFNAASHQGAAGVVVQFPPPPTLDAAVAAADAIAAQAAKVEYSAKDIRQQGLDDLHTQQQIRDLQKQLHARNKKHRLELRGLDRQTALAELADAKANLTEIRNQKQKDLEEARKAEIEALHEKRQEQVDTLTGSADIFAHGTSPGAAIGSVDRAVADITAYGQVMAQLKGAGASPALLQQLVNRANTGDFRSAIRLGRALLSQPATLGRLNASLASLGAVSSGVATMVTDPRFLGAGAWAPTPTNVVQVNLGADPSSWLMEVQRVVRIEVQNMMTGAIR